MAGLALRVAVLTAGVVARRQQRVLAAAAHVIREDLLTPALLGAVQMSEPDLVSLPGERAARAFDAPLAVPARVVADGAADAAVDGVQLVIEGEDGDVAGVTGVPAP